MYSTKLNGPRQANLVLIAYASSEGSGEPAHPRSLARTSAARSYKQWVKRNLQTESQIPGPSEWLGMRSWNLSWRNARRHKFAWRGSNDVCLIWRYDYHSCLISCWFYLEIFGRSQEKIGQVLKRCLISSISILQKLQRPSEKFISWSLYSVKKALWMIFHWNCFMVFHLMTPKLSLRKYKFLRNQSEIYITQTEIKRRKMTLRYTLYNILNFNLIINKTLFAKYDEFWELKMHLHILGHLR